MEKFVIEGGVPISGAIRPAGSIRQIDRGYERIDERLRELGARIERVAIEPVPV